MIASRSAMLAVLIVIGFAPPLRAVQPESRPSTEPATQPTTTTATASAPASQPESQPETQPKEEKPKDRYLLIENARVHTVSGPVLFDTSILCKNGRIHAIGRTARLPDDVADAEVQTLDATGRWVYPGLIAAISSGILGAEPPNDTTDVFNLYMTIGLAGGITTAVTGNSAAKLSFGTLEDHVVKDQLFVNLNYSTSNPEGRHRLRADFDKVRQYIRDLEAHERAKSKDPDHKPPDKEWIKGSYEDYLKLLRGERVAIITANDAHEILDVCDLAEHYGFRMVIRGAMEGWTVPVAMSRAKVSAIITPRSDSFSRRHPDPAVNRPSGWSIANASILHDHGVPLAIVPQVTAITLWGVAGRDLLHLNMEAAFAVRGGMPEDAALRAVTLDAARILGIDHRVGSIEVGKDADLIICDGDILHYMTHVQHAIVNGRLAYEKSAETLFSHIRPDGRPESPPPVEYWPRRLGDHVDDQGQLLK